MATPPAEPRPVRIPCPPPRGPRLEEAELLVGVVDDLGGVAFRLAVVLPLVAAAVSLTVCAACVCGEDDLLTMFSEVYMVKGFRLKAGEYLGRVAALQLRPPLPPPFAAAFQGGADRVTADAEFFAPLSATESEVVVVPFSGITKPFILLRVFRRLASIRLGLLDCRRVEAMGAPLLFLIVVDVRRSSEEDWDRRSVTP